MQNLYQLVKYSLMNSRYWMHVMNDVMIRLQTVAILNSVHFFWTTLYIKSGKSGVTRSIWNDLDHLDVSGRRALCSAGTNRILVPPVTSTTVGSRAFPVAASLFWNSLPDDVISAESLPTFQTKLIRHLFCQSFPGFCYWHLHLQWTLQWQCHLGPLN